MLWTQPFRTWATPFKRARAEGICIVSLICVASSEVFQLSSVALAFARVLKVAEPSWKQDLLQVLISVSGVRPGPSIAYHSLTLPLGRMTPTPSRQALQLVQAQSIARFHLPIVVLV